MKNLIQLILRVAILICVVGGGYVIFQSYHSKNQQAEIQNEKALTLRKFLLGYNKPRRIEIFSYTKRFEADVEEIKKMTVPVDENSTFYITVQFFTDENDLTAPLVAQVRFMDIESDNMMKEESINL